MAQTTWVCNKDTRTARRQSDGLDQGAGASLALPIGYYSGYIYQSLLGFSQNIDDYTTIDKAVLWVRTSDQYYVSFGSDPDINISLLTENWDEGDSTGLSTTNGDGPIFGQITYDGTTTISGQDLTPSINTWDSFDITSLIRKAKTNGDFKGLLLSGASTSASDVGEIWGREKGTAYRAYIVVDYTNNRAPNPPTLTGPADTHQFPNGTNQVTFTATASDPDAGDSVMNYHLQLTTDPAFGGGFLYNVSAIPSGISGMNITRTYFGGSQGPDLAPGVTYYWRIATTDAAGVKGNFSPARTFSIASAAPTLPTMAPGDMPGGGNSHVAPIHNIGTVAETITPMPQFTFTVRSPGGGAVNSAQVEVEGVGTDTLTGPWSTGAVLTHNFTLAVPNITTQRVRVRIADVNGYGAWSAWVNFACKFMQVVYQFNLPGAGNIAVTAPPGTLFYRLAGAGGTTPTAWSSNIPASVPASGTTYLNVMVRLFSQGTAPAQPTVPTLTITYMSSKLLPLSWSFSDSGSTWSIDSGARRYGIKSLRHVSAAGGGNVFALQTVNDLAPNTDYAYSAWVNMTGVVGQAVYVQIVAPGFTTFYATSYADSAKTGWQRVTGTFRTNPGATQVQVLLVQSPSVGPPADVRWDAVMLSEGTVSPVWTPALVGNPAVIDAQGIYVDGQAGGILRVVGSGGQAIEMGAGSTGIQLGLTRLDTQSLAGQLSVEDAAGVLPGSILVRRGTDVAEGGEVVLEGPTGQPEYHLDVLGDAFRIHRAGQVPVQYTTKVVNTGSHLSRRDGAGGFPGVTGLTTGDRFWRTDVGLDFYYVAGVGWVSTELFFIQFPGAEYAATPTGQVSGLYDLSNRTYDIYLNDVSIAFFINGGSALSGSNYWLINFDMGVLGAGYQPLTAFTINSGAVSVNRASKVVIAAVRDTGYSNLRMYLAKGGSPGNLQIAGQVSYRVRYGATA